MRLIFTPGCLFCEKSKIITIMLKTLKKRKEKKESVLIIKITSLM